MSYGMPKLEAQVKEALEKAYGNLRTASDLMDMIDTVEAEKISRVRKQVLNLLTIDLNL